MLILWFSACYLWISTRFHFALGIKGFLQYLKSVFRFSFLMGLIESNSLFLYPSVSQSHLQNLRTLTIYFLPCLSLNILCLGFCVVVVTLYWNCVIISFCTIINKNSSFFCRTSFFLQMGLLLNGGSIILMLWFLDVYE